MHVLNSGTDDIRVIREAETLVSAGYSVTIVGVQRRYGPVRGTTPGGVHFRHVRFEPLYVRSRPKILYLAKYLWTAAVASVLLFRERAHVYQAHDVEALLPIYLVARLRGARIVLDSHELPLAEPGIRRFKLLTLIAEHLLATMIRRCAVIFTVSPPIADEIQRTWHTGPVHVLRNIPRYQEASRGRRFHDLLGLPPDQLVVLYQGQLYAGRGLPELVEAAASLRPNATVVIMGDGPVRQTIEAQIRQQDCGERVRLIPPVPYAELLAWTASADVGVMAYPPAHSRNELYCLPNKFFEYLMAGVPIVTTPLVAVKELVEHYDCGVVVNDLSPAHLAEALNRLLADGLRRRELGAHAQAAARTDLNWSAECQVLLQAFSDLGLRIAQANGIRHSRQPIPAKPF
jgi:glycosyltransferase involved in cell wall biosynthesis